MHEATVGLLHPGEMGAAVGRCLAAAGHRVLWRPEGFHRAAAEVYRRAGADGSVDAMLTALLSPP